MVEVYLARHGQTFWNRDGIRLEEGFFYHGRKIGREFNPDTNPEMAQLTSEGIIQSERVADKLRELVPGTVRVYASTLSRAIASAQPTARRYGTEVLTDSRLNEFVPERGDQAEEAYRGMVQFMRDLTERTELPVVFSHGQILKLYLKRTNPDFDKVRNGEIIRGALTGDSVLVLEKILPS